MPLDECVDCGTHFPGGEGLKDGRCPACRALFKQRRAEASKKPESVEQKQEE